MPPVPGTAARIGCRLTDRASAAGDLPAGARLLDDSPYPPGHKIPLPLKRSPPASFKRLLGRASETLSGGDFLHRRSYLRQQFGADLFDAMRLCSVRSYFFQEFLFIGCLGDELAALH